MRSLISDSPLCLLPSLDLWLSLYICLLLFLDLCLYLYAFFSPPSIQRLRQTVQEINWRRLRWNTHQSINSVKQQLFCGRFIYSSVLAISRCLYLAVCFSLYLSLFLFLSLSLLLACLIIPVTISVSDFPSYQLQNNRTSHKSMTS